MPILETWSEVKVKVTVTRKSNKAIRHSKCIHTPNLRDLPQIIRDTRDVFYVRREVDLMKAAKVNVNSMHIFGQNELLSIHAT